MQATGRNDTGKADAGYRGPASAAREVELIARIGAGDRKALEELYNLYHVLNHANLFGGGYARQARAIIEHLLAQARR